MRDFLRASVIGMAAGLMFTGGLIAQQKGWLPVAMAEDFTHCQEDEPCWDARTMGNRRAGQSGQDWSICRWDGSKWIWDFEPVKEAELLCPFKY